MQLSLNQNACRLCAESIGEARQIGIELAAENAGAQLIDFGVTAAGSVEAGVRLARICLGDLGSVAVTDSKGSPEQIVHVATDNPLWACMGSQYAGWPIQQPGFFGMGSGPVRLLRGQEPVLLEYALREAADEAVLVLESKRLPTLEQVDAWRREWTPNVRRLIVCVAPTQSVAGTLQIVARSVESACHKLHELKFDLRALRGGRGEAPLLLTPPNEPDAEAVAMGRCNDAILLAGSVCLQVDCEDAVIGELGPHTPSCASPQFGVPFARLWQEVGGDFYRIDPLLFAPACVELENLRSGNVFRYGAVRRDLLAAAAMPQPFDPHRQ